MKRSRLLSIIGGALWLLPLSASVAFAHPHPHHFFDYCAAPEIDPGLATGAVAFIAAGLLLLRERFRGRTVSSSSAN